jgi:hypothetical protein
MSGRSRLSAYSRRMSAVTARCVESMAGTVLETLVEPQAGGRLLPWPQPAIDARRRVEHRPSRRPLLDGPGRWPPKSPLASPCHAGEPGPRRPRPTNPTTTTTSVWSLPGRWPATSAWCRSWWAAPPCQRPASCPMTSRGWCGGRRWCCTTRPGIRTSTGWGVAARRAGAADHAASPLAGARCGGGGRAGGVGCGGVVVGSGQRRGIGRRPAG